MTTTGLARDRERAYLDSADREWPRLPARMPKSDLPFGSEFSPAKIELGRLLELAAEHGGNWREFEDAVYREYFERYTSSEENKRKLANNTKLSMQAYGLIDGEARLTEVGRSLFRLRGDHEALHVAFARHILLNLYGLTLVQCIQDMEAAGETVDLVTLRRRLDEDYNVHFPRGGKHASTLRLWLEAAGVFVDTWRVDRQRLQEILGTSSEDIEALATLRPEQKAYLRALANIGGEGPFFSNDVERLAAATYGVQFNEKSLPKTVLYPLRDAGFITLERGTKKEGRGAKPFLVRPTRKLAGDIIEPLLQQLERQTHPDLRPLLRRPLAQILDELKATDPHARGLALEALAFRLMRLIDLSYVATRLRGPATGGVKAGLELDGFTGLDFDTPAGVGGWSGWSHGVGSFPGLEGSVRPALRRWRSR